MVRLEYQIGTSVRFQLETDEERIQTTGPRSFSNPNELELDLRNFTGRITVVQQRRAPTPPPVGVTVRAHLFDALDQAKVDEEEPEDEFATPTQGNQSRFSSPSKGSQAAAFSPPAQKVSFPNDASASSAIDTSVADESTSATPSKPKGVIASRFWDIPKKVGKGAALAVKHLSSAQGQSRGPLDGLSILMGSRTTKTSMPFEVKSERAAKSSMSLDDSTSSSSVLVPAPSRLHAACARSNVSLRELEAALSANPTSIALPDSRGRLPLHILGDNDGLVETADGMYVATTFGARLMEAYPDSITAIDRNGRMPFVSMLEDWILWVYGENFVAHTGAKVHGTDSLHKAANIVGRLATKREERSSSPTPSTPEDVTETAPAATTSNISGPRHLSSKRFPSAILWEEVEWSFNMLSLAFDELGGKNHAIRKSEESQQQAREKGRNDRRLLAMHLAEVLPTLLKTVLLIETNGGDDRRRLLAMPVFRRLMMCPESVDKWIVHMLRQRGIIAHRAVDYLVLVSERTAADHSGGFTGLTEEDGEDYHRDRKRVFDEIEALPGAVASLVVLETAETERAATSAAVWYAMNKKLSRPFVVGLVITDFVMHVSLMMAFRSDVTFTDESTSALGEVPRSVVLFICTHYFIRKFCEALSLANLSMTVFRAYFMSFWTFFDILSICLTIAAISWNDNNPNEYRGGLNALIVGLLWMKVLGFLKVVNKQMATFILSLFHILRDLRYFSIVFVVIIIMFGDMAHIVVSTRENGEFCERNADELSDVSLDFCDSNIGSAYLRVYSTLLGDFEYDNFTDIPALEFFFVLFTLVGVLMLLNVLIAVISDSYERATMLGTRLFGRARVAFAAQNEALESFLRPGTNPADLTSFFDDAQTALVVASRVFRWIVMISLIATAMNTEIFLMTRAYNVLVAEAGAGFLRLMLVLALSFMLTMAILAVVNFAIEGLVDRLPLRVRGLYLAVSRFSNSAVQKMGSSLFGLTEGGAGPHLGEKASKANADAEWTGRIAYLEGSIERTLEKELRALEKRLYEHQIKVAESASLRKS